MGLLTMTPAGAEPMWFITRMIESLKLGSGSSARATSSIVVNGFALSANVEQEMPHRTSNAQSALIMGRIVRACSQAANPVQNHEPWAATDPSLGAASCRGRGTTPIGCLPPWFRGAPSDVTCVNGSATLQGLTSQRPVRHVSGKLHTERDDQRCAVSGQRRGRWPTTKSLLPLRSTPLTSHSGRCAKSTGTPVLPSDRAQVALEHRGRRHVAQRDAGAALARPCWRRRHGSCRRRAATSGPARAPVHRLRLRRTCRRPCAG